MKKRKKRRGIVILPSDPDALIWNAEAIGAAAGCFKEDGKTVDARAAYYLIESGLLADAVTKVGRQLVSTTRKVRDALLTGGAAGSK
jgi:hypothetical protein